MNDACILIHGDCFDHFSQIKDESVDLIFTDLPYGVTQCEWDQPLPLDKLWPEYWRILKRNGAILLTGMQPFTSEVVVSQKQFFRYEWIWEKPYHTGHITANKRPLMNHEHVLVFYQHQPTYNPQGLIPLDRHIKRKADTYLRNSVYQFAESMFGEQEEYFQRYGNHPKSIVRLGEHPTVNRRIANDSKHQTEKDVDFLRYFIRTYTNPGDLVLDNCMGSGSCGVASLLEGRRFLGIEKEMKFFNYAENRIKRIDNEKKLF